MTDHFAVIGNPVAHSLSPEIHQAFAQQTGKFLVYEKILGHEQTLVQQVTAFFKKGGKGMNVTLPFKEYAFRMAAAKSLRASQAAAANTLWWQDNHLHADNTDGIGLVRDLSRYLSLAGKKVIILGAGGAARAIISALLDEQIASLTLANRSMERFNQLPASIKKCMFSEIQAEYDLVIHATSASMLGQSLSLPETLWLNKPFCYDLSYSLKQTTDFINQAFAHDCQASDGLGMLIEQAAESFFIWHKVKPDTSEVLRHFSQQRTV